MRASLNQLKIAVEYALSFIAVFWIIMIVEYVAGLNLNFLGVFPRTTDGLFPGIITAPLIHANFPHLIANTLPFGVLCSFFFFFYRKKPFLIFTLVWITAGLLTWLIGRGAWHIGASIMIYALASFLAFGGIMSRKFTLILASIIVILIYSGLIWGIFPTDERVSWEGHLSGAISGALWAYLFRKKL